MDAACDAGIIIAQAAHACGALTHLAQKRCQQNKPRRTTPPSPAHQPLAALT